MERRKNQRFTTNCTAEVRYRSGRKMQLTVLDISLGGCMVDARTWTIRPEEAISIKLPGLSYQPAKVIWIEDQRAGIALEELLYEPTLEFIQTQLKEAA